MKSTVQLDGKDVRTIIAKFLGIPEDQVIPMRYNYAIEGFKGQKYNGVLIRYIMY